MGIRTNLATAGLLACLAFSTPASLWAADRGSGISEKEETALAARLSQARDLIDAHEPARAIKEHLDPVIARYEAAYADSKQRVYCATDAGEALIYSVLEAAAADQGKSTTADTIVIGPTWADAYLLKGFALVEMKDLPGARAAVELALGRSPQNPQYLSEMAYIRQGQGDSQAALELYGTAAEWAATIEDEKRKLSEAGRACRGQGYALIELGRIDDAEAKYKSCIELDPSDKRSMSELDYIAEVRARSGAKP